MNPDDATLLASAVQALASGSAPAAAELARELIARQPSNVGARQLLGVIAGQAGDFAAAAAHFEGAIAVEPGQSELHRNLGCARQAQGRLGDAETSFRQAVALAPQEPAPLCDLANLLWVHGRLPDAARAWEQVLALQPRSQAARFALGSILSSLGFQARAAEILGDLEREAGEYPGLQVNLGLALMKLGRCGAAIACYDRAIAAAPDDYRAHNNRGNALRDQQRMVEAVGSYRRALAIKPDHATAHSNLLLTLNYTESSPENLYQESLRFARVQASGLAPASRSYSNGPDAGRVLRVGYVSADFRRHSVALFLSGLFAVHDRQQVRVCCYSNVAVPDAVTASLRLAADEWVSIAGVADAAAADRIRDDGIDILVDLGGHTGDNRLLLFARAPAPVQVSWLGYPNTTGLPAIDYRLTDAIADPVGAADVLHTEELVRLPRGFLCYHPASSVQDLGPAPAAVDAPLTFGSFNTLSKITPDVIRVWAEILRRLPAARLLLKSESLNDPETRRRYEALFRAEGVATGQLELIDWVPDHRGHLELYSRVDLALDPFPYNGATTTCEALWMGVPVLTLRGIRHASRVGASILSHAGLAEWVADDEDAYIAMAVARGSDRVALAAERARIAAAMRSSPLADSRGFTRSLEEAYRELWQRWCAGRG